MYRLLAGRHCLQMSDDFQISTSRGPAEMKEMKEMLQTAQTKLQQSQTGQMTEAVQEHAIALLQDMVVAKYPDLLTQDDQELLATLTRETATTKAQPSSDQVDDLGRMVGRILSKLQGKPEPVAQEPSSPPPVREQHGHRVRAQLAAIRESDAPDQAKTKLRELHQELKGLRDLDEDGFHALLHEMKNEFDEFKSFMINLHHDHEVELKTQLGEAQEALQEVNKVLVDPNLGDNQRSYWIDQKQLLERTIADVGHQLQDLHEQRTGPLLQLTPEEAQKESERAAQVAAQQIGTRRSPLKDLRQQAKATSGGGGSESKQASGQPGAASPVPSAAAPPSAATADRPAPGRMAQQDFRYSPGGQQQARAEGVRAETEHHAERVEKLEEQQRVRAEIDAQAEHVEKKIEQHEQEQDKLASLADDAADERLKQAGVRREDLVDEIGKKVRNEPGANP